MSLPLKSTPGPWFVYCTRATAEWWVVTNLERPAFNRICAPDVGTEDYGKSNAHLIAAAPDLYEQVEDDTNLFLELLPLLQEIGDSTRAAKVEAALNRGLLRAARARGEEAQ